MFLIDFCGFKCLWGCDLVTADRLSILKSLWTFLVYIYQLSVAMTTLPLVT